MMLVADVTFSTEGMVVITSLIVGLAGAIGVTFKLLMKAKDDHLASQAKMYEDRLEDMESERKSYKSMAEEAVNAVEVVAAKKGVKLRTPVAVVPEHASPPTEEQIRTADIQTLRARVTAAVLAVGVGARGDGDEGENHDSREHVAFDGDVVANVVEEAAERGAERGAEKGVKNAIPGKHRRCDPKVE